MSVFPKEMLTSELGTDQRWHARYPSATRTLCGRVSVGRKMGRKRPPTCETCLNTAHAYAGIDATMPAHWAAASDLKEQVARLRERVRELERSRDLWRQRALGRRAA